MIRTNLLFLLILLLFSCADSKKQRDTRNLSWIQITMDAKAKHLNVGIWTDYLHLVPYFDALQNDETVKALRIKATFEAIQHKDSLYKYDFYIGDYLQMTELHQQFGLLTPSFSKLNACEQEMRNNSSYKEWMNITDNNFIPWLVSPITNLMEISSNEYSRLRLFHNVFTLNDQKENFIQHPDVYPQWRDTVQASLQNLAIGNEEFSDTIPLFNLPIFIGVNQGSKAKAASLVLADAMMRLANENEQLNGVMEFPERKPSFHPEWMKKIIAIYTSQQSN